MSAARNLSLRAILKLFLRYLHATVMYAHQACRRAAPLPFILPAAPRLCRRLVGGWTVSCASFDASEVGE